LTPELAEQHLQPVEYTEALATLGSSEWRVTFRNEQARLGRNVVEQLTWMQNKASTRTTQLPRDFHEVWYALVQELRHVADEHEYLAMRDLHGRRGRSWQQVAHSLGLYGTSRQRVQQRFGRLSMLLRHDAAH
jgi:hypothetical protein